MLQRQSVITQIILRFTPATNLKIGTFVLIPKFKPKREFIKK